jgi:hypothetical protein
MFWLVGRGQHTMLLFYETPWSVKMVYVCHTVIDNSIAQLVNNIL